jgi:fructose-bisphosphate aldolase class I
MATLYSLEETAQELVAAGKGILAADETVPTLSKRFAAHGIPSTVESRRDYRLMLLTAPGLSQFVSGVILHDETIHQTDPRGEPLAELLVRSGMIPGIKVDTGAHALAGGQGELVTEGLDGLRHRLQDYRALGARFAKWRAVIRISPTLPSDPCLEVNAHALARYAALCQEQGLVPIVEPEVLMDGTHRLSRSEEVTGQVLSRVFAALRVQRILLEGMLLKPNMVIAGSDSTDHPPPGAVAAATLRVLRRQVPVAVPGIVFLSGGQDERQATVNLNAINTSNEVRPWRLSFSYGRALQDSAMVTWGGRPAGLDAGQAALLLRARCNSAAALGQYDGSMETAAPVAPGPAGATPPGPAPDHA